MIFTIILVAVITGCLWYLSKHHQLKKRYSHLPGITRISMATLGRFNFLRNPKGQIALQKKFGKIYKIIAGSFPWVIISDPEMIKQVLVTQQKKWTKGNKTSKILPFKKPNLFRLPPGKIWKRHRNLLTPSFSDGSLKNEFETSVDQITTNLIKKWTREAIEQGKEVNASEDIASMTFDIIGKSGFGQDFKILETGDLTWIHVINDVLGSLRKRFLYPTWFFKIWHSKLENNFIKWKNLLTKIVHERRIELENPKIRTKRTDLLSKMMVAKSQEEDEPPFDNDELVSNTHLFLIAGHETTGNTLRWALWFLATHPEIQEKVRKEVTPLLEKQKICSYETFNEKFDFTRLVIKETLRLKTPASLISRENPALARLGKYKIPKQTMLVLLFMNSNISEEIWGKNVMEFKPERFEKWDAKKGRYVYTPFSIGSRSCIGRKFSEMEMVLGLAKICKEFSFSLSKDSENVGEKSFGLMQPDKDIKLILKKIIKK